MKQLEETFKDNNENKLREGRKKEGRRRAPHRHWSAARYGPKIRSAADELVRRVSRAPHFLPLMTWTIHVEVGQTSKRTA